MATRAQLCVVSLLIPLATSGCIFDLLGGGGSKPHAAAPAPAEQQPVAHSVITRGSSPEIPVTTPRDSSAERRADSRASRRAQEQVAVPPDALSPEAGVKWPDPAELRLADPAAARAELEPEVAIAPRKAKTVVRPQADEEITSEAAEQLAEPARIAARSEDAVANESLEVRPAAAAPQSAPIAVAAQPSRITSGGEVSARIARNLRESPGDLAANLDYQLMRFLADEPAPDLNSVAGLPAEDRELLVALLDGLANFRTGLRSEKNLLLSQKIRPLLDLAARVGSQADLTIPTIALCSSVKSFGMYEPMDPRFIAMQANETVLYCEVGNASSQQNPRGEWESQLSQEAVLFKEDGQRVWSDPRKTIKDVARNRRHDFFLAKRITLPANLSTDRYILKVTVMDEQVKRVAEATMPIEIVSTLPQQEPAVAKPALSNTPKQTSQTEARTASARETGTPNRVPRETLAPVNK